MKGKREAFLFALLFVLGFASNWQLTSWIQAKNNTPERVAQRAINTGLQEEICDKVQADIDRFKEEPRTFRRTSLSALIGEVKEGLRHLLKSKGVPPDFPIEFVGEDSQFSKCEKSVRTWLDIPSAGSQLLSEERALSGLGPVAPGTKGVPGAGPVSAVAGQGRLALVIGNSEYLNRPLLNPKSDADDVSAFLKESGFEVIDVRDGDLRGMQSAVADFSERLKAAEVGLVYYSGHGVEHMGRNYLIPVNARINDPDDIPRQTVDASSLVERVSKADRKINIFVIDACRSSFVPSKLRSASQGLAKMEGTRGTIIAFSTSPGTVAEDGNDRNSPYTRNLLKAMSVPGRKIEDVFKETARKVEIETAGRQLPWYNSSLLVDWSIR